MEDAEEYRLQLTAAKSKESMDDLHAFLTALDFFVAMCSQVWLATCDWCRQIFISIYSDLE